MKETRTMVSPPPGFANRVMERVETYKQARARQRAFITIGVFAFALVGLLALLGFELVSQFEELPMLASQALQLVIIVATLAEQAFTLFDVLWLSVTTITSSINGLLLIAYACIVVGLTVVWLRVAFGPFQYSLKLSWRIEQ